jgi:Fe-S cluster assembly ATP-binding protein
MKNRRGQDISLKDFRKELKENMKVLKMDAAFANRYLNEGFSGGEKKRLEILQMALLKPVMAILDETDSGLDIDALRIVSDGINRLAAPDRGILLITHYQRLLDYVKPQFVHVLSGGKSFVPGARNWRWSWKARDTNGSRALRRGGGLERGGVMTENPISKPWPGLPVWVP